MPDANPKYDDLPRPSTIEFFENGNLTHKMVESFKKVKEQRYIIKRRDKSDILLYLTNLYVVSLADIHEIIQKFPEVNCIVTISSYNSYTKEAKFFCIDNNIALFRYKEYYGALFYDKEKFINYKPKE